MKYMVFAIVLMVCSCSSKPEMSKEDTAGYHPHLLQYIHSEYVIPAEKECQKLEQKYSILKEKVQIAKPGKHKQKAAASLKKIQTRIETLKLWPIYYKELLVNNIHDTGQNEKAESFIDQIKIRYKELNNQEFPDVEQEFKDKYLVRK